MTYTIPRIDLCAGVNKFLYNGQVPSPGGEGEGRPAVGVGGARVRARAQQQPHGWHAPILTSTHKRCCSILKSFIENYILFLNVINKQQTHEK